MVVAGDAFFEIECEIKIWLEIKILVFGRGPNLWKIECTYSVVRVNVLRFVTSAGSLETLRLMN